MLRTDALQLSNRSTLPKKRGAKYVGPLEIKKVMGPVTYQIELPPTMKRAHNVFHVSKLKTYVRPQDHTDTVSVVVDASGNTEQMVHAVLDEKRENRKVYYLVQLEGDTITEASWMQKSELNKWKDLVKELDKRLKGKSDA